VAILEEVDGIPPVGEEGNAARVLQFKLVWTI
jgi:hypothetical protein